MADDKFYNEEGEEVEIEMKSEEEMEELEERAAKVEEHETKIKEMEDEIGKYKDKEFNFSNLRGKSQEDKDELLKEFNDKEKKMIEALDRLQGKVDDYRAVDMTGHENDVLTALAGDDEELKTKIKERAKDFVGEAKSKEDVLRRYKDSFTLIQGSVPSVNPINQFVSSRGEGDSLKSEDKFTKTDRGKAAYNKFFPENTYKDKK